MVDGQQIFELDFINGIEVYGEENLVEEILRLLGL